jgi:hypothetical protein
MRRKCKRLELDDAPAYGRFFWRENVFKIVPVQVPTKLEMWQNYVAFVFVGIAQSV